MAISGFFRPPSPPPPPPPPSININDLNTGSPESPEDMRLFAVLIGINYPAIEGSNYRRLHGPVRDAERVYTYLRDLLDVPADQIIILANEDATRLAIIKALSSLRTDDRIRTGDAILIFYAGYGNIVDAPGIVPYDATVPNGGVEPISDFVLEILLARIASHKGNNITVIFDCNNSAPGSTLSGFDGGYGARIVDVPSREDEITTEEARFLRTAQGATSHILLTACGPKEFAREINGQGVFTKSLLKLLNQVPPYKLRYSDIVHRLNKNGFDGQNPQCEGLYRNRVLFNRKAFKSFHVQYDKTVNNGSGGFYVHTGTTHNFTLESKISIYRESDFNLTQQLGVLLVDKLCPLFITAKLASDNADFNIDQFIIAIAEEEKIYLGVYIPPNDAILRACCDVERYKSKYNLDGINVVNKIQGSHEEIASMDIDMEQLRITIRTLTYDKFNHLIMALPNPYFLPWLLSRMTHFYRELEPSDTFVGMNTEQFHRNIKVEFYQLQEVVTIPAEATGLLDEKLDAMGQNLYVDGMINLVVADQDGYSIPYGLKLINGSDQDLHVNLFHFTNSDLSISRCVESDPSILLRRQGDLTIGYGRKGDLLFCFEIADDYSVDVGFLKIYLSTQPVDLRHLPQKSPLTGPHQRRQYMAVPKDSWTEIVIPIKQQRNDEVKI